jgi:hypothetical protein
MALLFGGFAQAQFQGEEMAKQRFVVAICFMSCASGVFAQELGAIAGVVRDQSGAVIPAAIVEASSPALIEGHKSTITDSSGQYRIIDLRPGVYTVTFARTGFQTLKRENIALDATFTVTVNGDLSLGQASQQVEVTEAAPLVDVQNSLSEKAMDRATMDAIPTGRDPFAVGQIIPGVTTATPDVGGTGGMQQPTLQVHGSAANDNVFVVDGMMIQHVGFSGNQTGFYYDDSLMQSISYLTSSLPAEAPVGGIELSMIPRDGGNQFHGSIFGTGATSGMQSDNSNANLVALGLKARNKVDTVYDLNASLGGPIIRNKLWFFAVFRRWGANNYLANTFTPEGAQAIDDNRLTDITFRLTYQINDKNKVSVSYDRGFKFRGHRFNNLISASFSDPLADVVQKSWMNYMAQAKYTSTITNHLVFDFGATYMPVYYNLGFEPGATPGAISEYDIVTSTVSVITPREDFDRGSSTTYVGNLAYVTGSHELKTGVQSRQGYFQESFRMDGDELLILSNGTPTAIRLYNTPLTHRENLDPDLGWFLQDSWKVNHRLTLNLGIRFDHMNMNIPAQNSPAGTWVPERSYAADNGVVDWNTWSPRLGFAWDMFGNSRTALKGGISRYDRMEGTTLAENINPNFITYETCPWSSLTPPIPGVAPAGCTGFPGNNYHIDPNMKRPYQWEYTAMIQRQIAANTSVSVGYYGRHFYDLYGIVNTDVPSTDYTAVQIANPLTGSALTVYNQLPSTLGQISYLEKTLPNLYQRYNGVEFQANSRIHKLMIYGGLTIGKNYGTPDGSSTSSDFNNPNVLINYAGNAGYDSTYQLRVQFAYTLPGKISISGSLRENSGLPQSRSYTVTQAIVPGLTQVTQSILVAPSGAYRYPWQNLFDIRLSRTFKLGEKISLEPIADIFNVFNSSAITSEVTTIGSSLGKPSNIDMGRLLRLGGRVTF